MFKYLQRFNFIDKERYLYKAFQESNLDTARWLRNIKNIFELYGEGKLIQNIIKKLRGKLVKAIMSLNKSSF